MRVELGKRYRFEAAHRLPHVPPDHKCHRLHGHSFEIEICVTGEVGEATGWLMDFGQVTAVVEPILKAELDHRTLNDVPGLENATSEMLCLWLWRRLRLALPQMTSVTVYETCAARCTYRGD